MSNRLLVVAVTLAVVAVGPVAGAASVGGGSATDSQIAATSASASEAAPAASDLRQSSAQQPATCNFTGLYDDTIGSVATIQVTTESGESGLGSGFVYDDSGHLVTNQHVVANASTVEVQFNRGEWRSAEVVGTDAFSDLAVLDVNGVPDYADPLDTVESLPDPGRKVAALGSPLGLQGSITQGVVSGVNRSMPTQQGFTIPNTIQTDAPINPGNSGGPLVTCDGDVVGVNRATAGDNIGFAIPATTTEQVVPVLIQNGSYDHAFLGVSTTEVTPSIADGLGLDRPRGILVVQTIAGSPASEVLRGTRSATTVDGVQVPADGDVIVSIEGNRVLSQEDLASFLAEEGRPGETVTMTVIRDGDRQRLNVTLGERPTVGAT